MHTGDMFGRYRLDRPLGADFMGELWSAFDTERRREVELRILPLEASEDDDYQARFGREAGITAQLQHPHIVPVHDYGLVDDRLFLATQPVAGVPLPQVLAEHGPMDPLRANRVVEQLAAALDSARAAGLDGRIVAPETVLIADQGGAYLSGVGLALNPSEATDAQGLTDVLVACLAGDATQRRRMPASVPAAMRSVIERGRSADPVEGYATAGAFAAAARATMGRPGAAPRVDTGPLTVVAASQVPNDPVLDVAQPVSAPPEPTAAPTEPVPAAARAVPTAVGAAVPARGRGRLARLRARRGAVAAVAAVVGVGTLTGVVIGVGSSFSTSDSPAPPSARPVSSQSAAPGNGAPAPAGAPAASPAPEPASVPPAPEPVPVPPSPEPVPVVPSPEPVPVQTPVPQPPAAPVLQPSPAPVQPSVPEVLPCYPGYVHTPPPDGPCWAPDQGAPAQAPAPAPAPAQQVLPCYAGYAHTPPPDGPCLPAGRPASAPTSSTLMPSVPVESVILPCYAGYTHTPAPDGPCLPIGDQVYSSVQPEPEPAPAPAESAILPCYPGYVHTPPPDGPCWAPA